jgi:copper resistance protein C
VVGYHWGPVGRIPGIYMNRRLLLSISLLAVCLGAAAHTAVKGAKPADGATLDSSPASIEITFEHPVQMTSISVVAEKAAERKVTFTPTTAATTFTVDKPALTAGHNEVHWKALSKDGHVVTGKLTYTIKPAGAGS